MKRMAVLISAFCMMGLVGEVAFADENLIGIPSSLELRQGFVIPWENPQNGFMNMTTTTLLKTEAYEKFGRWNALWEGWSLEAAWSYDAGTSKVGLMLGRHLGTLGKYLPVSYPLADKVDITIYPLGIIVDDPVGQPEITGASGAGIIKLAISF